MNQNDEIMLNAFYKYVNDTAEDRQHSANGTPGYDEAELEAYSAAWDTVVKMFNNIFKVTL